MCNSNGALPEVQLNLICYILRGAHFHATWVLISGLPGILCVTLCALQRVSAPLKPIPLMKLSILMVLDEEGAKKERRVD